MSRVDELFAAFKAARAAGERPRLHTYLSQLDDERDRRLLGELVTAHVDAVPAPRRGLAAIQQDPLAQRAMAAADLATAETWPVLLPAARDAAQLSRTALVQRLADALGVGERAERVGDFYHRMETGSLPADGVQTGVLEALGELVQVPVQRLREAGRRTLGPAAGGPVFARAAADVDLDLAAPAAPAELGPDAELDEVDRLFTAGD